MDDSVLPRAAARAMLSAAPNLRLVGEASSGAEALTAIDGLKPDLILMDVHMPEMDGPATAKAVLVRYPEIKVVAWTVSESSDDLLRMMKESTPLSQRAVVPLTSREMEILRAIAKGHTTKRMAKDLGLAPPSIETHLHNIFRKLNATNRGEAVSAAMKVGLITLSDL